MNSSDPTLDRRAEQPPPPPAFDPISYNEESTLVLFRRLRGPIEGVRFRDRNALRDYLVLQHTPLVEHCARGLAATGEPVEDLVQEGYVGLIKAVDRFDPDKGVQFSTYACHLITGEMRHYLRDLGKLIHEPGWHSELRSRITRTSEQLSQQLTRPAEPEEIARTLNIPVETVRDVQSKSHLLSIESLDAPKDDEEGSSPNDRWLRSNDDRDGHETRVDDQMMLDLALPQLRDLEKRAITMFFFQEKSKTEIARALDISVNYAAYLVKRGIESLRDIIDEGEQPEHLPQAQQQARAAYLLSLASGGGTTATTETSERRAKPAPSRVVPAATRAYVGTFGEFAGWLDEEMARASRYGEEFGVGWLQVRNWAEMTEFLSSDMARRAQEGLKRLTRRGCRGVDKMAVVPQAAMPGANFLVLMPRCGDGGFRMGFRWAENVKVEKILPSAPQLLPEPELRHAFVMFPRDGKLTENLLSALRQKILS